jgi:hypothetical protein
MARDVPLIWPSGKAKYFLLRGLTRIPKNRIDLPDGLNLNSILRDLHHGQQNALPLPSPARWIIRRLRGDQHMRDDQELSIDELSAVVGGATSTSGGFHPKPPVDIIKWILSLLK